MKRLKLGEISVFWVVVCGRYEGQIVFFRNEGKAYNFNKNIICMQDRSHPTRPDSPRSPPASVPVWV